MGWFDNLESELAYQSGPSSFRPQKASARYSSSPNETLFKEWYFGPMELMNKILKSSNFTLDDFIVFVKNALFEVTTETAKLN